MANCSSPFTYDSRYRQQVSGRSGSKRFRGHTLRCNFFAEIERFECHLERLRYGPEENRAHIITEYSPNYLHDSHYCFSQRVGTDVICEKPLEINP